MTNPRHPGWSRVKLWDCVCQKRIFQDISPVSTLLHPDCLAYSFCREEDDEGSQVESEERRHLEFWIPELCFGPRLFSNPIPGSFFLNPNTFQFLILDLFLDLGTFLHPRSSIYLVSWILGLSSIMDLGPFLLCSIQFDSTAVFT